MRRTNIEDHDCSLVYRCHTANQLGLITREFPQVTISPLGLPIIVGTNHHDCYVTIGSQCHGLTEEILLLG